LLESSEGSLPSGMVNRHSSRVTHTSASSITPISITHTQLYEPSTQLEFPVGHLPACSSCDLTAYVPLTTGAELGGLQGVERLEEECLIDCLHQLEPSKSWPLDFYTSHM
jgi:hypothetical protein